MLRQKRRSEPAVSVDTKKKETLGNKKNAGRTYEPKGQPRTVDTHDFPDKEKGKAVPYGVYDIHRNEAAVSVGVSLSAALSKRDKNALWPGPPRALVIAECPKNLGKNGPGVQTSLEVEYEEMLVDHSLDWKGRQLTCSTEGR